MQSETIESPYQRATLQAIAIDVSNPASSWETIRQATMNRLTKRGVDTLRSGLDGYVGTVIVEPQYVCKDYRNLYSHFLSKKFIPRSSRCSRLHFFSTPGLSVAEVVCQPEKHQEAYIGYSVINPVVEPAQGGCLGRTIINPFRCGQSPDKFYCLQTKFRSRIQGATYFVMGYPYMSQSGEATKCAHAALWNVCRYLSERYSEYREVYPYDLIQTTGDTEGRRVPYRGMLYSDYSRILSEFGCYPVILRPRKPKGGDWMHDKDTYLDIYSYVESGFPVLMSFYRHVASIIGHTTRDTLAFKKPDEHGFHNSFALLDQYVAVDDNFFPYQLLGDRAEPEARNYGRHFKGQLDPWPSKEDIFSAVVPLPEKAFMKARDARRIASGFFGKGTFRAAIDQTIKDEGGDPESPLVTRLFLTSSNAFKDRKRLAFLGQLDGEPDKLAQVPLLLDLPHFMWIMEIGPLDMYNKHFVVGGVALDASASLHERGLIYGRIGNMFTSAGKLKLLSGARKSIYQYTHNLGERP